MLGRAIIAPVSAVAVSEKFPATVHAAQTLWEDTARWTTWVDGLDRVVEVAAGWPAPGAHVRWESGPAGRGEVIERVSDREPLVSLSTEVSDETLQGSQRVSFEPVGEDTVLVTLSLEYRIRRRTLFTPLIDVLFVRRAMRTSLLSTLERFGGELAAARPRRRP